jgi:hypothetical protein
MRKIVLLTLTVTCIALTGFWGFRIGSKTYDEELFIKVEENWLCKLDRVTGETQKIIKITKWITSHLSVSPHSKFISFIETEEGTFEGREYKILPKSILTVLDPNGKTVCSVEDVQRYTWSPDGNEIVYITGSYYEGGVGFSPRGVHILNVVTGEKKEIENFPTPYGPYALHWANFEYAIYIKNLASVAGEKVYYTTREGERKFYFKDAKRVLRYDCQTGQLDITDYKDICFSPDGKYYIHFPDEVDLNFNLYEIETNKDITDYLPNNLGSPSGWVFNNGHLLLFQKTDVITKTVGPGPVKKVISQEIRSVQNFIFDVEKKKVIKQFDGKISSWIGNGNKIVVEREGKIVFEELPKEE